MALFAWTIRSGVTSSFVLRGVGQTERGREGGGGREGETLFCAFFTTALTIIHVHP